MVWMCDVLKNEINRMKKDGHIIKQENCNKDCSISPTKIKKQTKDLKTRLRLKTAIKPILTTHTKCPIFIKQSIFLL